MDPTSPWVQPSLQLLPPHTAACTPRRPQVNAYLESQAPADVQDEGDAQDEEEDGDDGNEDAGHATGRPRARS